MVQMFQVLALQELKKYTAVAQFGFDGGIEITASHNPINYNGMKILSQALNH